MLPFSFKRDFDVKLIESLYQHLRVHDNGVTLVLRAPGGRKVDDAGKASSGEIKGADGRVLFLMKSKEGVVHLKRAGDLKGPLVDFLKEHGFDREEVKSELAFACVALYAALVAGLGLYYVINAQVLFLYPVLLACVGLTLAGLWLLSHSCKPGQEVWGVPAMTLLVLGAFPTAPACILAKPMLLTLGRKKLQYHLGQEGAGLTEAKS